jgi:hypothetical protein
MANRISRQSITCPSNALFRASDSLLDIGRTQGEGPCQFLFSSTLAQLTQPLFNIRSIRHLSISLRHSCRCSAHPPHRRKADAPL